MSEYHEFADLAGEFSGVHLDTTMAGTDYVERIAPLPKDYLPRLADLGDKVVLGSDFPNIPYPYAHQLEALDRLDLGDDWLRAVVLWAQWGAAHGTDPLGRATGRRDAPEALTIAGRRLPLQELRPTPRVNQIDA
jgi:hypothetical protein